MWSDFCTKTYKIYCPSVTLTLQGLWLDLFGRIGSNIEGLENVWILKHLSTPSFFTHLFHVTGIAYGVFGWFGVLEHLSGFDLLTLLLQLLCFILCLYLGITLASLAAAER